MSKFDILNRSIGKMTLEFKFIAKHLRKQKRLQMSNKIHSCVHQTKIQNHKTRTLQVLSKSSKTQGLLAEENRALFLSWWALRKIIYGFR